jgi:hypothetical protein
MMKRINPETGKPFKSGDTRADDMVFRSYQLKRKLPSDPQYYYENWYSPAAFEAKKASTNEQVKKFDEKQRTRAISEPGRKRVNAKTGEIFKFGDLSLDGKQAFASYVSTRVGRDGYIKEIWLTLAAFEKHKNRIKQKSKSLRVNNRIGHACRTAERRAKSKNVPFDITTPYLTDIYPADDLCPVFNTKLEWGGGSDEKSKDNSPSLDRIIPELGYVEGNVVWISNRANILKRDATWEELQKVASWLKSITPK